VLQARGKLPSGRPEEDWEKGRSLKKKTLDEEGKGPSGGREKLRPLDSREIAEGPGATTV